jgi:hypothetical protein
MRGSGSVALQCEDMLKRAVARVSVADLGVAVSPNIAVVLKAVAVVVTKGVPDSRVALGSGQPVRRVVQGATIDLDVNSAVGRAAGPVGRAVSLTGVRVDALRAKGGSEVAPARDRRVASNTEGRGLGVAKVPLGIVPGREVMEASNTEATLLGGTLGLRAIRAADVVRVREDAVVLDRRVGSNVTQARRASGSLKHLGTD